MPIGIVPWTLRHQLFNKEQVEFAYKTLSELGFDGCESLLGGAAGLNQDEDYALMQKYGLRLCSVYCDISKPEEAIATAKKFGVTMLSIPAIPANMMRRAEGFYAYAQKINEMVEPFRGSGLRLQYHNHSQEFRNFPEENGKINVMLIGNSFARDFGNILLESHLADQINISYAFDYSEELCGRLDECDVLFCYSSQKSVPDYVWEHIEEEKVWGIGTKSFGENNGQIYRKRFSEDYFTQSIIPNEEFIHRNEQWGKSWGERYIDLMEYAATEDGRIRVFSHENKFISQDCIHLTPSGARFYAQVIEWSEIEQLNMK